MITIHQRQKWQQRSRQTRFWTCDEWSTDNKLNPEVNNPSSTQTRVCNTVILHIKTLLMLTPIKMNSVTHLIFWSIPAVSFGYSLTNTIKTQALSTDKLSWMWLAELISVVSCYTTAQLPANSQTDHLSQALNMQYTVPLYPDSARRQSLNPFMLSNFTW